MCWSRFRAGAWALAGAVMVTLAAGCSASGSGHAAPPRQGSSPQIFTMKLVKDHRRLDRGVLTYSKLAIMQVRQGASFDVVVTDVGRGPQTSAFARQARGRLVGPQDVPTGGTVSVQIVCSAELACKPRTSSPRQAILGVGRSAAWKWEITARSPGNAQILVTTVSYRRHSGVVASQTSVAAGVKVRSTPLYTLEAAFDARKKVVAVFVAAAVLAAVLALGVVLDLRRRGRGRPAGRPAPRPAGAAEPRLALRGKAWPRLRGRTWLGLRGRAWLGLAAIDAAAGALVIVLVRHGTSKSLAFAIIAAGVAVVLLPVYFLPVFIARARRVPDLAPVTVINMFLGWTFVGWVVALALAVRDRRPGSRTAPEARNEHPGPAAQAAVPRMRLQPVPPADPAVTLMVWQAPDDSLTCHEPGDTWVHRWTYGVSLGEDDTPRFVLTGERGTAA